MNPNLFTEKAREAVADAQHIAEERHNSILEPEHLMLALLQQSEGLVPRILERLGADPRIITREVEQAIASFPTVTGATVQLTIGPRMRRVLELAQEQMRHLKDDYLSVEHLLLGLTNQQLGGALQSIFVRHDITFDNVFKALAAVRGSQRVTSQNPESTYEALERYGRDLTKLAREGRLDPVIGRDEEIRRVIQVLSRRTKNNPVLIGEPGVGKTAIV